MAQAASVTVQPQGQTLVVNFTAPGSAVEAFYSDAALTASVTLPYTVTADTTFYTGNFGPYTLSVTQPDGTELRGDVIRVAPDGPVVVAPLPTAVQVAADLRSQREFLPTGALAQTYPRTVGSSTNFASQSTGRLTLVAIDLPAGLLISSVTFMSCTTALSVGTNQWFALYSSSRALLRQTVDDTSTAWASLSTKTLALTSTFTTTYSGLHYLGVMVAATTVPTLMATVATSTVMGLAPVVAGVDLTNTGLTTTAPNPAAALTAIGGTPYAYVS